MNEASHLKEGRVECVWICHLTRARRLRHTVNNNILY